ncbi:MAG TPA: LytTR family DNA-binding domain-containing protein [Bacteroidales bacterium]|nr:LytTR family DNA-binding domain-containing protein [Bacteroidales bacterium]HPJ55592.1 LytTR family DNA-binding domain-containing protein [Bacteroidales bacterium]HPQ56763.1 LytTR family DNA-binding domain-containing protein [Bacteroidales bacterium]
MKRYFSIGYWLGVVLLMSFVFASIVDNYSKALLLAIMFLPGALLVKFFMKDLSFENRLKGILHSCCLALATLFIEYLSIIFTSWYLFKLSPGNLPDLIFNPILIWLLLAAFIALERIIEHYVVKAVPPEEFITFTSERKKVSVRIDSIMLVESRDSEVLIHSSDNSTYRTKMKISQWESVLDERFMRVHRSYLINLNHIRHSTANEVTIGDHTIEVSRKYRDSFRQAAQIRP